ncbi:uncharacterized protein UV8b_04514 [Ustilaginoidea virens]|uniref:Fungal-type protein kinase domain-containing protein n=1 Tax=Ustilaginoidea virens TaxID=1159556 RepID=A0A8E5HRX5_USTVR|nr:uncharacterized protein UV8b_04514 [Ustilaginoidea virens]QUC20273.1 hypothetical protein UV8b_04514 [Ustilaginoidea virens]
MINQNQSDLIKNNPIGDILEPFRSSFRAKFQNPSSRLDQLNLEELQALFVDLLTILQTTRACRLLKTSRNGPNLLSDLFRLGFAISSGEFELVRTKPLLQAALADCLDEQSIWDNVYDLLADSTSPPRSIASVVEQTPWRGSTGSIVNSSELRDDVSKILREELGPLYVGVSGLHDAILRSVPTLDTASEIAFRECIKGDSPLFDGGWTGWPILAIQDDVVAWLVGIIPKLEAFAGARNPIMSQRRKLLAQPRTPLEGSTGKRSLDVGFVNRDFTPRGGGIDAKYRWSQVLVAGELKSNPKSDIASDAWIDLAKYAREVLAAQDTRRFVLGFTLCGPFMRIWQFDRIGGIASEKFDINDNAELFIKTILGFLWIDTETLGFDPTIVVTARGRHIEIQREGKTERLILDDKIMYRAKCIAGRATTCWKAYPQDDPKTPLVIKDSWQYTDKVEEGALLREATEAGVVNIARYYHHEIVRVGGVDDDISHNVRQGLDITKATNYRIATSRFTVRTSTSDVSRKSRATSAGMKRTSSETNATVPPSKRSCLTLPANQSIQPPANRIHTRTIMRDYGKPIYDATSPAALLGGLAACIKGHESLVQKKNYLHRDISINNLRINEDEDNPSYPAFLIDLDHAIDQQRKVASGAKTRTGTRAFMAIGALLGENHSFMHDLESFFWVLLWICVHFDGQQARVVKRFDEWNYLSMEIVADLKKALVIDEDDFCGMMENLFTPYYQPLAVTVNRLRRVVFPQGKRWKYPDLGRYQQMKDILVEAQKGQF